ncbi:MAG: tail fiber assembly protein, partial [Mixta calida]|nr:tail fiber assembly protein [Mixta calida]
LVISTLIDYVRTAEDDIAEAEAKKAELRLMADSKIAPLHDAVSLGIATDEETASYDNWRKFRVLLNRVDTAIAPDIN